MPNSIIYRYKTTLIHLTIWVTLLIIFAFILENRWGLYVGLKRSLFMTVGYGFIVYLNVLWLMPNLLYKKKYLHYFIGSFVIIFILFIYFFILHKHLLQLPLRDLPFPRALQERPQLRFKYFFMAFGDMMIGVLMYISSCAFKSSQMALLKEKEAIQLRSDNLSTELKFLRSQINPHFLFNALHNIYTLSLIKSDKTSKMIIMLSNMLRYMLYDCKKEKVMIKKEVDYLQNFITLAKLKDDNIEKVRTNFDIQKENLLIEPMLFIPFLENSFKHSKIEDLKNGWIDLQMEATSNNIIFNLTNSIPKHNFTKDRIGGIGLENVKRRLLLLYRDRHELSIRKTQKTFSIKLNLLV